MNEEQAQAEREEQCLLQLSQANTTIDGKIFIIKLTYFILWKYNFSFILKLVVFLCLDKNSELSILGTESYFQSLLPMSET